MSLKIFDVWSWHGTIGRGRYLATGLVLLALKHNIDRVLAAAFGYPWSLFNYWVFDAPAGIERMTFRDATFYEVLLLVALPFVWIGTVLTCAGSETPVGRCGSSYFSFFRFSI